MIPENYIKMCEKAEEIQKAWKPKVGDYALCSYAKTVEIYIISKIEVEGSAKKFGIIYYINEIKGLASATLMGNILKDDFVWLPTQEQLQEMTEGRFHIWGNLNSLSMTASIADRDSHQVCKNIDSMNELWLCYVMKEKYNKIWTGQKWVKAEEMIK